jgi:signal transduction histidine kinase
MAIRTSLSLRRRSKWLEFGLALLAAVSVAVGASEPGLSALAPEWLLIVGLPLLALTIFLFRRTAPLIPFALAALLAAFSPVITFALFLSAYAVGRYEPSWRLRIPAAVLGVLAVAQPWAWDRIDLAVGSTVGAAFSVLLPGAVGAYLLARAELLAALRERAERAEAERELLAKDAVLTERTRIAREMHDAVGHRVSLMVLQAGAIEMAADDRDRVATLAEQVQAAGRQALDELRQAVGVLRSGEDDDAPLAPQPGIDDLERLVKECRTAGMHVQLRAPSAVSLDPVVSRAAYRIVQEALTNAGKHAPDADVTVHVEQPSGELKIRVVNGAPGRTVDRAPGGGFGLVGLAERVRTLDGRFRAEPRLDGGFVVEAVLPT